MDILRLHLSAPVRTWVVPARCTRWLGIALTFLGSPLLSLLVGIGDAHAEYPGPNGQIAFGRLDRAIDGHHIFTADLDGTDERQLLPGDAESPFWSPDGSRVLVTLSRAGAPLRPATLNPDGSGFTLLDNPAPMDIACSAWSPDGTRLLCQGHSEQHPDLNGIYTARATDAGGLLRLTDNPFDEAEIAGDYSPDGARIVFTRQRLRHGDPKGALFVANSDGTGPRQITPFGMPDPDEVPKWSPDGTEILFGSATEKLVAVHPDGTGVREISPRTLGKEAIKKLETKLLRRCRKRSGKKCRTKATKRANRRATGIGFDPGWSPDGERIVFSLRFRPGGRVDIYTARSDGTHLVQITDTRVFETFSDWGPHPVAP
jgi:Tol biopolymer transport system component